MNPSKKLDWNVTDKPDLISMSQALFGGPLTGQTAPVAPPPPPHSVGGTGWIQVANTA